MIELERLIDLIYIEILLIIRGVLYEKYIQCK